LTILPPTTTLQAELSEVGVNQGAGNDLLRGILAGCGDCIKILDLEGRLQFMSEGGRRVMEVDDFAPLKGCPWPDFWVGEGNAQALAAVAEAKAGRTSRFQNEAHTAKGTPRYWDVQVSPILNETGQSTHILSISRDITEEWNASQKQAANLKRQQLLVEELTHRVKNTLATVIALANQTFRGDAHKTPRDAFMGRIKTMGDSYNILTEASWGASSIQRVVESALDPFRHGNSQIKITGVEFELNPGQALILALAVNELATNAVKYGALSVPAGHVEVSWTVTDALRFQWVEMHGPAVSPPARSGFGSVLIKTLLAGDFNGTVDLRYDPSGVTCKLEAPLKAPLAR
jgi:two-component sensor histidine kinase